MRQKISLGFRRTFKRLATLSTTTHILADVSHGVKTINLKTDRHKDDLCLLRDKLAEVGATIENLQHQAMDARCSRDDRLGKLLEDIWNQTRSEFPRILKTLGHIQEAQSDPASTAVQKVTMQNLKPSSHFTSGEVLESHAQGSHAPNTTCDLVIQEKLEEMLLLLRDTRGNGNSADSTAAPADLGAFQQTTQEVSCTRWRLYLTLTGPPQLRAALVSLHNEVSHRELREKQQQDSIRYLNELNSVSDFRFSSHLYLSHGCDTQWLEAFVKTNTIQLQETALSLRRLCHELGVDAESSDQNQNQNGPRTVIGDVQQLVFEVRKRDADSRDLKQSIDALVCQIGRNAEDRSGFSTYLPHTICTMRSSA
jgi:hypothetical protein